MELFDTHVHLYEPPLAADPDGVLARAAAAGVTRMVVPAYDVVSWDATLAAARRPGVYAALGLHPWVADQPLDLDALRAALVEQRCVAVGEVGLDAVTGPAPAVQRAALRGQLALACELGLPAVLHCRGAFEELLALLRDFAPGLRGVVHAFARGPELLGRFLELGLCVAFGGAATRPGSRAVRSVPLVPPERLLLETDAPSIGLHGIPAPEVEPRHVRTVAEAVARLRGTPLEELAALTTANARALFRV
jgi:TatD DNase family protein